MQNNYLKNSKVIYLSLFYFGVSSAMTFHLANLSIIYKFYGAKNSEIPFLWLAAPVTGLIVQPLLGKFSDNTITSYGKRRPYMIGCSLFAAISFFLLPFCQTLFWVVLLIWIIDANLNGTTETLRALTSDLFQEMEKTKAFVLQAIFGGMGAIVGAGLPYLTDKFIQFFPSLFLINFGKVPVNIQVSFFITGLLLALMALLCMYLIKERIYNDFDDIKKNYKKSLINIEMMAYTFKKLWIDIVTSPFQFKKYCIIHSISWIGIFIFWLYFSTVLAHNMNATIKETNLTAYQRIESLSNIALAVSFYLSIYQYILSHFEKIKLIHGISVFIGGLGIILISFPCSATAMVLFMIAVGIMWGSMIILPYVIVSYVLPKEKVGAYFGIFNISITLPQILTGLLLSPLYVYVFKECTTCLMVLSGTLLICSALFWIREAYLI
jgi:maltose/moltooligosaccharide transporter